LPIGIVKVSGTAVLNPEDIRDGAFGVVSVGEHMAEDVFDIVGDDGTELLCLEKGCDLYCFGIGSWFGKYPPGKSPLADNGV